LKSVTPTPTTKKKKNNNKISSDMGSVTDPKSTVHFTNSYVESPRNGKALLHALYSTTGLEFVF